MDMGDIIIHIDIMTQKHGEEGGSPPQTYVI